MKKIPQKTISKFQQNFHEYKEEEILKLSKLDGSIYAVLGNICKEVFGLYILDENSLDFKCHIFYITKVKNDLKGYCVEISPKQILRNEFVSIFSSFITQEFKTGKTKEFEEIFNTFQNSQIITFEQYGYDIITEFPAKRNAEIIVKYSGKGVVYVPRITTETFSNGIFTKELIPKKTPKLDEHFVYLMYNKRNEYYKIGRTKNVKTLKIREKTLQSEEPEVITVGLWIVKENYEKILHSDFRERRLRGEWFNLNETDLNEIDKKMSKFACS